MASEPLGPGIEDLFSLDADQEKNNGEDKPLAVGNGGAIPPINAAVGGPPSEGDPDRQQVPGAFKVVDTGIVGDEEAAEFDRRSREMVEGI